MGIHTGLAQVPGLDAAVPPRDGGGTPFTVILPSAPLVLGRDCGISGDLGGIHSRFNS
jgi:hypothetical protein